MGKVVACIFLELSQVQKLALCLIVATKLSYQCSEARVCYVVRFVSANEPPEDAVQLSIPANLDAIKPAEVVAIKVFVFGEVRLEYPFNGVSESRGQHAAEISPVALL